MEIFRQSSFTRENLGLLAVMEVLENQERITQRELARATGLNLKKVNYCLRKLLEKGHVKFQRARKHFDKRTYLYILTPSGFQAKSQLTYRFLKFTLDFYNKMELKLQRCLDEMGKAGVKRVILYGASDVARILLEMMNVEGLKVVGVLDTKHGSRQFQGVSVIRQLEGLDWDGVLITTLDYFEEAEGQLQDLGVTSEKIWKLS